jgi:hypothetical protein
MVKQYKKDLGTDRLSTTSVTANVGFGTAVGGGAWLMFFVGHFYKVKTSSVRGIGTSAISFVGFS